MSKNILFIVTKGIIGGAQRFVQEQIEILCKENYKCFLATNKEEWLSNVTKSFVTDCLIDKSIEERFSISYLKKLRSFIEVNKIRLVVCNSANGGLYGRLAAFSLKIDSVYVSHGWSSVYNGGRFSFIYNNVEYLLSKLGSSVLCISENDYRIAVNKIKIHKQKLKIIQNCIIPEVDSGNQFYYPRNQIIRLLAVARLDYPKRIDLLIDAVGNVEGLHLTVVGDGKDYNSISNKVNTAKLSNVRMLGKIDNFKDFESYDIFTLISESEGLPISALEAMSSGNALLLSDVGGCRELIRGNGVLVSNTKESIIDGIDLCRLNLGDYKRESLLLFKEKFDLNRKKELYIAYYNQFLGE